MADRENIDKRWRIIRNQQLCLRHRGSTCIAVLLFFRSGRLDLYPNDGFVASLDDEDIVPNVHFRNGDIDSAMEEFGHYRQVAAPAKKYPATAGLGIVCRPCRGLIRRQETISSSWVPLGLAGLLLYLLTHSGAKRTSYVMTFPPHRAASNDAIVVDTAGRW